MNLAEAVRRTLMPGFAGPVLPSWLDHELDAGLGSVCLFGSNIVDADQTRALTDAIHDRRPDALVATDEEGGDVTRLHHRDGSPYPSPAYLGRADAPASTEAVYRGIGGELRLAGIDLDLAPVADVNCNPANPVIGVRSFGATSGLVARHVAAAVAGLQSAGVAATAKHFPGHGDTDTDSHRALPTAAASLGLLRRREFGPFRAAIDAGVLAVMTSHILVPALDADAPATMSPRILGLLRDELGFTGAIVSDALDMAGASAGRGIAEAAVLALGAGVDLLCIGTDNNASQIAGIARAIEDAVAAGRLPESRVRDAAARVDALAAAVADLRRPASAPSGTPPVVDPSAFWTRRPLSPLVAPVLVQLESPANMAAGPTVWGVGEHLRAFLDVLLPGATCASASGLDELAAALADASGRPVVVQGRDLDRVPFLRDAVAEVRSRRPDAVVVDLGWPSLDTDAGPDVATFGSSRGTALALIGLLARGRA